MGVDYFPKSMSSKVNETAHEEIELTKMFSIQYVSYYAEEIPLFHHRRVEVCKVRITLLIIFFFDWYNQIIHIYIAHFYLNLPLLIE